MPAGMSDCHAESDSTCSHKLRLNTSEHVAAALLSHLDSPERLHAPSPSHTSLLRNISIFFRQLKQKNHKNTEFTGSHKQVGVN